MRPAIDPRIRNSALNSDVHSGSILSKNAVSTRTYMCTDGILRAPTRSGGNHHFCIRPDEESGCDGDGDHHPSETYFDNIGHERSSGILSSHVGHPPRGRQVSTSRRPLHCWSSALTSRNYEDYEAARSHDLRTAEAIETFDEGAIASAEGRDPQVPERHDRELAQLQEI
jgi:hypothetical protein